MINFFLIKRILLRQGNKTARGLIRFYQLTLSPFFGGQCRFYPTCSYYAIEAIARYGLWHGLGKSFLRVIKCHPLHPGGYDPV